MQAVAHVTLRFHPGRDGAAQTALARALLFDATMLETTCQPADTVRVPRRFDTGLKPAPAPHPDEPRYVEERLLGQGGMGVVRLVADRKLGRSVAMKVMQPELASCVEARRRFLREARVQGLLEHPSVVPVYDSGEDERGCPWFTMQRVRGSTLESVLAAHAARDADALASFPRRRLLTAFVQVCLALDFAHSRGVVHRDLKPGNVMLGEFGDVHVLDWGLARVGLDDEPADDLIAAVERAARGGSVFGTPGYMAPEQIRGERVDGQADVYALGAMLFEILTLTPLHPGLPGERVANALRGVERSPAIRAPAAGVPPELDAAVLAATHPDVQTRTASARELANAVERSLDGVRDSEVRRQLAERHVCAARPVVEHLEAADDAGRQDAVRQLVSALALEPGAPEALGLLQKTLSHVPARLPASVVRSRDEQQGVVRAGLARTVAARMAIWVGLTPVVLAMGAQRHACAAALVAILLATFGLVCAWARRPALSRSQIGVIMLLATLSLTLFGSLFGSLILVPPLVATSLVMFAGYAEASDRRWLLALALGVVLLPLGLEHLGLVAPAYAFTADAIVVLPRLVHFPPELTFWVLVVATVLATVLPGVLAGRLRDRLAEAETRLLLVAWHLEALEPVRR
ncbi:MAG: serine/threonine-protein kinase [Myxococcaceae bacterium]|nr:serine/threonine-protein kinase [Myxococcaceae bacterium]